MRVFFAVMARLAVGVYDEVTDTLAEVTNEADIAKLAEVTNEAVPAILADTEFNVKLAVNAFDAVIAWLADNA